MKNKLIKILSVGLLTILFTTSCSDWLDVNTDPNNPADATMELVFTAGVFEVAANVGGYYNLLGGMWSQYYTQSNAANQYKYIDGYICDAQDFQSNWSEMYAGALNDLQYTIKKAEAAENWSMYLMATSMQVYAWQMMADLYDEIPYSEALLGSDYSSPEFEKGSDIYADLISKLDNALSKDLSSPKSVLTTNQKSQDQVFGGDISKWIQFANTLKLKIYLRQMYANPSVAQAGVASIMTSGAPILNEDAMLDIFIDEKNKDNPLYSSDRTNLNVSTNLRASATFFNYLDNNNDPRFSNYFDNSPGGTKGTPLPQGGFDIISTVMNPTNIAVFHLEPTTPVYFFSLAEIKFMLAELAAKGWIAGSAKSYYDEGVMAAFNRFGLDGSSFIASGGAYEYPNSADFNNNQEAIITQKWISMAGTQGIEAFFETNRTHYPAVSTTPAWNGTTSGGSLNGDFAGGKFTYSLSGASKGQLFPKRLVIPINERTSNSNVPADLKAKDITDKVWWDKK